MWFLLVSKVFQQGFNQFNHSLTGISVRGLYDASSPKVHGHHNALSLSGDGVGVMMALSAL